MSQPISTCMVSKAALGDEKAFQFLVEAMEYNRAWGAFTIFPCECNPPCPRPTDEQIAAFDTRLEAALEVRRKERLERARAAGTYPIRGFDKFIFPIIANMAPMPVLDLRDKGSR